MYLEIQFQQFGEGDGTEHANNRSQGQHETNHYSGKVDSAYGVQDNY